MQFASILYCFDCGLKVSCPCFVEMCLHAGHEQQERRTFATYLPRGIVLAGKHKGHQVYNIRYIYSVFTHGKLWSS